MLTVATIRCPCTTACGVRWGFAVAFVCLSNVAVAGFVPAGVATSHERQCDSLAWLTDLLDQPTIHATVSGDMGGRTAESPTPAHPNERALQKIECLAGLLVPTGGSTGSGNSGGPQTLTFTPLLPSAVILADPQLVSRLDAEGNDRLPLKLPYKLFRPPKCV